MAAKMIDRDHGWKKLFERVKAIESSYAKVGLIGERGGGDVEDESGLTVAEIGVVNEFGSDTIPARPFVRSTFDAKREELAADGKKLMVQVLDGRTTVDRALSIMGLKLATEIKKTIVSNVPPPNAPSTLRRKEAKGDKEGGVKTLIDTGRMLNSISWVLKHKGEE